MKLRSLAMSAALWMSGLADAFAADEMAATAIEYGLIAGLIALVIIGGVSQLGSNISAKFFAVASNLS